MDDFEKTLERHLQEPEFRKEWEASEEEYQIEVALITASDTPGPCLRHMWGMTMPQDR